MALGTMRARRGSLNKIGLRWNVEGRGSLLFVQQNREDFANEQSEPRRPAGSGRPTKPRWPGWTTAGWPKPEARATAAGRTGWRPTGWSKALPGEPEVK